MYGPTLRDHRTGEELTGKDYEVAYLDYRDQPSVFDYDVPEVEDTGPFVDYCRHQDQREICPIC